MTSVFEEFKVSVSLRLIFGSWFCPIKLKIFSGQIAPSCDRMFLHCKWKGKRVSCKKYVKQMKTDDGFCCSLNTLDLADSYVVPEDTDSAASSASSFMGAAGCNYGNYDYDYHHYDSSTSSRKNLIMF